VRLAIEGGVAAGRVRIRARAVSAAACLAPGWGGINAVAFNASSVA
jgi:hypothetical protein